MRIAVTHNPDRSWTAPIMSLAPGIILSCIVALAAFGLEAVEVRLSGHRFIENLVLAILIGTLIRSLVSLSEVFKPGIRDVVATTNYDFGEVGAALRQVL